MADCRVEAAKAGGELDEPQGPNECLCADQVANIEASAEFGDLAADTTAFNGLLAALKTAGVMIAD